MWTLSLQLFIVNIWLRHPMDKSRPLIYYELVMIFFPLQLGGANLGVVLVSMFPDTVLLILAVCVLLYAIFVAIERAVRLYDAENQLLFESEDVSPSQAEGERRALLSESNVGDECKSTNKDCRSDDALRPVSNMVDESLSSEDEIAMNIPWKYIAAAIGIWVLYAASYLAMDASTKCTVTYYVLLVIVYPFIFAEVIWGYDVLVESQQVRDDDGGSCTSRSERSHSSDPDDIAALTKSRSASEDLLGDNFLNDVEADGGITAPKMGFGNAVSEAVPDFEEKRFADTVLEGDVIWEQVSFIPFVLSFSIGCLSVMLGVGGGELFQPLLLSLNIKPAVVAATLPCMLILNTSSSLLHYMTIGDVPYLYSVWMFCIGLAGGYVGRTFSVYLTDAFKRASIIVFIFVSVLLLSLGLYIYYLYVDMDNVDFSFTTFCNL
jgi:uncharacterized membrane protein YfcA